MSVKLRPHHIEAIKSHLEAGWLKRKLNHWVTGRIYGPNTAKVEKEIIARIKAGERIEIPQDPYESELCGNCPYRKPCEAGNYNTMRALVSERSGLENFGFKFEVPDIPEWDRAASERLNIAPGQRFYQISIKK